jgi:hypothetical protein
MSRFVALIIYTGVLLSLSACKTWYKLYMDCLKRAGWHYSDTSVTGGDPGPGAATEVKTAAPALQHDKASPADEPSTVEAEQPVVTSRAGSPQAGGWVQFGAETEQLENAKLQCDEAGAGSEAFNDCMHGKGWRPISFRITVEEPGDLD